MSSDLHSNICDTTGGPFNENFTDIEWCEYAKSAALKQIHFNLILIIHDKIHIAIYLSTFVIKTYTNRRYMKNDLFESIYMYGN